MSIEENIKNLKIVLPDAKAPVGSYVATKIVGKLLFISGQISTDENGVLIKGSKPIIYDMRNIYSKSKMNFQGFKYFSVGR